MKTPYIAVVLSLLTLQFPLAHSQEAKEDAAWGSPEVAGTEGEVAPKVKKKKKKKVEAAAAESKSKVESAVPATVPAPVAAVSKKEEATKEPVKAEREVASETPGASRDNVELEIKTKQGCFVLEFKSAPGTLPACSELLPLSYTKRNCETTHLEETGETQAVLDCNDPKRLGMKFKTNGLVVSTVLNISRDLEGRKGVRARFTVHKAAAEKESAYQKLLPEPTIKPTIESKPEEAPLKFKASGYTSIEHEIMRGFGFNGINSLPNISGVPVNSNNVAYRDFNILSNISFDVTKDQTTLSTVLEVGEVYFGDSGTGGARYVPGSTQQDRKALIELRNFFLTHEFTDRFNIQGGILALTSDPRVFIYADNVPAFRINYKADLYDGYLYYAEGYRGDHPSINTRPTTGFNKNEWTAGFVTSASVLGGAKGTLFGSYFHTDNQSVTTTNGTESAQMVNYWLGTTLEFGQQNALTGQFSAVGNWNKTSAVTQNEVYSAYLLDGKISYVWDAPQLTFTLEGLATSGGSDGTFGKRRSFQSPAGTHYLYNIAGSDGWDDAPGSARDYVIAPLSQQEGLMTALFTASKSFTKKLNGYLRGGVLSTSAVQVTTNSKSLGSEVDFGASYQVSPSTTFQFDFGEFNPGKYYGNNLSPVYLSATKVKFSF